MPNMAMARRTANGASGGTSGPRPRGRRRDNRRQALLEAAARHFRQRGYSGAALRDIADAAGMLAGSIYYYFPSKEDLFVAVHGEGVRRISAAVDAAASAESDPWRRLEAAMAAHLEALLEGGDFAQVVIRDLPAEVPREPLVALRDGYEDRFRHLIGALPLEAGSDRGTLRLMLLGALNWSRVWYRPAGDPPARIAEKFVGYLRSAL